jgi:hypothetical protein
MYGARPMSFIATNWTRHLIRYSDIAAIERPQSTHTTSKTKTLVRALMGRCPRLARLFSRELRVETARSR